MIVGLLGTQNGTTESMHEWEKTVYAAYGKTVSHFKLHIDVFEGDEKVLDESDIIILFHKSGDEKTSKLLNECIARKKTFICVVEYSKEEKYGGFQKVVKEASPSVRTKPRAGKGIIGRFKK